jgi:hypothetical protein
MRCQRLILILPLILTICLISSNDVSAQEKEKNENSAEHLISDYYNSDFKPFNKGRWYTRLSLALSEQDLKNSNRGFDNVLVGNDLKWNMNLSTGYYFSKYFMVGLTFGYNQAVFTGDVSGSLGSVIETSISSETFSFTPFLRTSIPLTKSNRLSLFNDLGMVFAFGNLEETRDSSSSGVTQKIGDTFGFGIGLTPGITYFAMQNFALEIGLNLVGYSHQVEKSQVDQDPISKIAKNEIAFQINLLSLKLGVSYYFGTKK